jgi:hypothetical protein
MKYLIMALSLLVTPFFSQAFDIFEDGTVIKKRPKSDPHEVIIGVTNSGFDFYIGEQNVDANTHCTETFIESDTLKNVSGSVVFVIEAPDGAYKTYDVVCSYDVWDNWGGAHYVQTNESVLFSYDFAIRDVLTCPPREAPSFDLPETGADGLIAFCLDPSQISMVDDCNIASGNQFLAIPVVGGSESACFTTENGSKCKYDAVDVGGGVQAYAMDLEGDCYSNKDLPDISGDPSSSDTPASSTDTCKEWGGTGMICPEEVADVCDAEGNCDEGCGTVNGIFSCIDNDLDGDSIPDYLDPDVDGDGIANGDDLDNDGDGIDDAIDNTGQGGSGSGTGSVSVNVDLGPVVSELKKLNKSISETEVELKQEPSEGLESFWISDYEDGLEGIVEEKMGELETTAFYSFLDQFQVAPSGASANFDMCFNLGAMGNFGCHNFNVDPRTFPAIKIFILISAAFLCRRILFGG